MSSHGYVKSSDSRPIYSRDRRFWETYTKGRPPIPDSFFERIFTYHSSHDGNFGIAHDAGAGAGIHSLRLARKFDRVIVSDASAKNIATAQVQLQGTDGFSFRTLKMEDASGIPLDSVDLFFTATAIHFCGNRIEDAISEVGAQLKHGGTLAIAALGFAVFDDSEIQRLWTKYFQSTTSLVLESELLELRNIFAIAASGYDAVPLPTDLFAPGAQRIKINFPEGWKWRSMQVPPPFESEIPALNLIESCEHQSFETDDDWAFEMDLAGLRAHRASFPFLTNPQTRDLWDEIEHLVGDKKITGVWPVVLILATRK